MSRIYVASSWKNHHQPGVVEALRVAGHEVYDFRNPAPGNDGFRWTAIDPTPRPWDVETYRRVMAHPIAAAGHALDFNAMKAADACVLVLPAGRSASWELGWCMGAGKHGIVLQLGPEEPELMFRDATICGTIPEVVTALQKAAQAAWMTYVLAWDAWQFRHWCRQNTGGPALLVDRLDHLRGVQGPNRGGAGRFVVLPGAERRIDYPDIVQAARVAGFEVEITRDPGPQPQPQLERETGRTR